VIADPRRISTQVYRASRRGGGTAGGRGAQEARHVPIIGNIAPTNPLIPSRNTGAFLQRLRELGWIEPNNHSRVSLGGRTPRTTRRDCRRVRPDQSRPDRHVIN